MPDAMWWVLIAIGVLFALSIAIRIIVTVVLILIAWLKW